MATSRERPPTGAWLIRRYPGWWRDRYGDEVLALLEDRPPSRRDRLDLAHGAIDAHLRGGPARSRTLIVAALTAGGAWTMVGAAAVTQPTPLDWPGYDVSTLPLVTVAAAATTVAQMGLARRAWSGSTVPLELLLLIVLVGGLLWTASLAVATVGGPYGAVTAGTQTIAAIAGVGLGLAVLRAGWTMEGSLAVVLAVALLIPTPAVWLAMGAGWSLVGMVLALASVTASPPAGVAR